jgi:phage anti-repressor protein
MTHERLDIVQLIENNPLEKLSNHYQTQLLDRIKETFDDSDQQLFIASFYCYLKYDCKTDFIIDMDDVWKWLGFSRRDHCKRVVEKHFTKDTEYKILLPQIGEQVHGGHNKEKVVMNVETFKSLCLLANTERSKSIRKYYYKLEELLHGLLEEQAKEKQKELEEKNLELIENFNNKSRLDKHKFLLDKFSFKQCIYLSEIDNNKIKIGSTNDINVRKTNLKDVFGVCLFLDVFECKYYREVEKNILILLREHLYKEPVNGHLSKEIVQLSDDFNYNQLVRTIKEEIDKYDKYMFWKDGYRGVPEDLVKVIKENNRMIHLILDNLEKNKVDDDVALPCLTNTSQIVNQNEPVLNVSQETHENDVNICVRGSRGRKIQEIDPDNLNTIKKVYSSMIQVLRENSGYEKHCIQNSIKNNTIYKGSRWLFVEHNQNPNIVNDIKPTVKSVQPENNYILKINLDQTEILDFLTGIGQMRVKYNIGDSKIKSILESPIIFDNAYFMRITQCPKHLLDNYELPIKASKRAQSIKQININTGEESIYKSKTDVYIKTGITMKKLVSIIKNKDIILESRWKYVEPIASSSV